jgi:SAM-dependent methyltransferase
VSKKVINIILKNIDYLKKSIDSATKIATEKNLPNAHFIHADCREIQLETTFDSVICLYDVIGSYADNQQNIKILQTIVSCLKSGGYALISVMNMELTEHIAKNKFSMSKDPDKLLVLPASHTMEQTGDIFDPDYFIVDMDENIIYRKEKFGTGGSLPAEILVRDRRFKKKEIEDMCCQAGLNVVWSKFVRAGEWNTSLLATNPKAKEILILCTKA